MNKAYLWGKKYPLGNFILEKLFSSNLSFYTVFSRVTFALIFAIALYSFPNTIKEFFCQKIEIGSQVMCELLQFLLETIFKGSSLFIIGILSLAFIVLIVRGIRNDEKKNNLNAKELQKTLRKIYKNKFEKINTLLEDNIKRLGDSYFNPSFIKEEKNQSEFEDEKNKLKEKVKLDELLKKSYKDGNLKAFIHGKAGVGKSTLCKH